jgi:hypothetical protein
MSLLTTGAGVNPAASAPPATTTWNPADKGADITLTNGNLTATDNNVPAGNFMSVRAIASHSSGKFYYETTTTTVGGTSALPGMGNSTASLTAFLGADANAVSFWPSGTVDINNTIVTTIQTWATGDTVGIAVDLTAQLIWFQTTHLGVAGNWNNSGTANPATGVGGVSISTMAAGPYFPMVMVHDTTCSHAANFGATAYTQTPPSGFGNW